MSSINISSNLVESKSLDSLYLDGIYMFPSHVHWLIESAFIDHFMPMLSCHA